MESLKRVIIDSSGKFKYIQILVGDAHDASVEKITLIRGYKSCAYHANIFDKFRNEEVKNTDLDG